jgi:hypothetical protein
MVRNLLAALLHGAVAVLLRYAGVACWHNTGHEQYRRWRGPHGGRGGIDAQSRAAVDRGRRLGQNGEVGSSIGVSQGGVAHWRGLLAVAVAQRKSSPVLGWRSGG